MSYAKVIYPYQTGVVGDLELQLDDIIEVLEQVDSNWYRARFKDKIGLVPSQFIACLPNINLNENQSLYIAHTDYYSTHEEDLKFHRGDLLIVHEHLSNGWLRGSLHLDLPGTTYRPTGIFPNTFVSLVKENSNKTLNSSSQNDLLLFDSSPIKFVRVLSDIKPNAPNELGCFEDEILAIIENQSNESEWLIVKNRFNSIGCVKRTLVESIDEKQIDDEQNDLLIISSVSSKPTTNPFDSLQDLVCKEFDELMNQNSITSTAHIPTPPTQNTYSPSFQPYTLSTNSINRNNNNNNNNSILNVQSLYPSLPLNQFSTILTSNKTLTNVCHSPLSSSSLSSFDEQPAPPVKPRLSLRPQLPPPPPPPSTFSSSIPQFRGPTRPAPKPPVQIQAEQQQISYRMINNPFEKNLHSDETSSTRDSCDLETSSTRTDFFDLELKNLHNQLLIDNQTGRIDVSRRQHVISELVSTERDYLRDLDLLIETYLNPNSIVCPESINKNLLFGNLREIAHLSRHLLNQLEVQFNKSQQNDDAHCCIGQVFNGLIDQFKTTYAEYCRNHEWVHGYLRKHASDEKLQQYLQDGLCKLRLQKSTIFDVSALLLQPIQRIVRYPLILNELFKYTPNDHIDYLSLKDSISNLISMANFINEFKRRKEIVSKYQRREKDEALTNKLYRLNMHTMKKKSARMSRRLSSAFGLAAHTIDERFNFEEQRFRSIEKFLRIFVRNAYICMEGLKETFVLQVGVAEDFQELFSDKMPDIAQQFVRARRSLMENAFTEFCTHMESCVANPLNTLIKLFVLPSNLISKRHDKLLDYDSAQSAYEKSKDQPSRQSIQVLDLAKKTYEALNSQLLEELPVLYEYSCQILSICLKTFILGHYRLFQQLNVNIHSLLPTSMSNQLSWLQILERFNTKINPTAEQIFQLTITAKNFSDKIKNFSPNRISTLLAGVYQTDKEINQQTDDIRRFLRNRYVERDLFTVIRNFTSEANMNVRNGDLVAVINRTMNSTNWLIDNGVQRDFVPHSILISISSTDCRSHTPPTPLRNDIQTTTNSERIYSNEIVQETHQYASIDFDDDEKVNSVRNTDICIALYDFECTSDGVLSLRAGEQLKILRQVDDAGNNDWWYVEKFTDDKQHGYVPANYIQKI